MLNWGHAGPLFLAADADARAQVQTQGGKGDHATRQMELRPETRPSCRGFMGTSEEVEGVPKGRLRLPRQEWGGGQLGGS